MAASTATAVPEKSPKSSPPEFVHFDFSKPPLIDGFNPLAKLKDETLKEKLLRKTKENPFVPIGELYKLSKVTQVQHRAETACPLLYSGLQSKISNTI